MQKIDLISLHKFSVPNVAPNKKSLDPTVIEGVFVATGIGLSGGIITDEELFSLFSLDKLGISGGSSRDVLSCRSSSAVNDCCSESESYIFT